MDLFKSPFLADVWGTVSDWVMIGVTGLTAIFLYRTLQSQKEVQHAQNKLLEIEQIKLIKDFKPVINYNIFHDAIEQRFIGKLTNGSEFLSIAAKNSSENIAVNYDFITPINSQFEMAEKFFTQPSLIKGDEYAAVHFIIKNPDNKTQLTYIFHFSFTYSDLIGTKYEQRVYCRKDKDGVISLKSHIPEIINLD